jgi:hypothetical protein
MVQIITFFDRSQVQTVIFSDKRRKYSYAPVLPKIGGTGTHSPAAGRRSSRCSAVSRAVGLPSQAYYA